MGWTWSCRCLRGRRLALVVAVLAAASLGFAGSANAAEIYFNGFGSDPPPGSFGANAAIFISGTSDYLNDCTDPDGIPDGFSTATDVYVVAHGSAADGAALSDVGGTFNTIDSFLGGGLFEDEFIGQTAPAGPIGPGTYDIVFDACQDGKYNASEDAVFSPAFTVSIPADVPPVDSAIHDMKIEAGKQALPYLAMLATLTAIETYQKIKETLECVESGVVGCAVSYVTDKLKEWQQEQFMKAFGLQDPKEAAKNVVKAELKHWSAIFADPPDANFAQPALLGPVALLTSPNADPLDGPETAFVDQAATEGALAEAILHALERYQGADAAGNGDAALLHARELQAYAALMASQLEQANDALDALGAAVAADPRSFDPVAPQLEAIRSQIADDGFAPDQLRALRNAGLDAAAIDSLHASIAADDYSAGTKAALAARIADAKAANTSAITALQATSANMAPIIAQLQADDAVFGLDPVADAGGPYTVAAGATLHLDGAASYVFPGRSIVSYAWDVDGDGAFDDASTAAADVTLDVPHSGLVALKVTDSTGDSAVAYAELTVTASNHAPSIAAASPAGTQLTLRVGDSLSFTATATDADGDATTTTWLVDGSTSGTAGSGFVYAPGSSSDVGMHWIRAIVSDGHADGVAERDWGVLTLAEDGDGDGWNANVDCLDSNAAVHPGQPEIVGNGLDDDCDLATLDTGNPPTAAFTTEPNGPSVHFVDGSTDPNDDIASWSWDFGDGSPTSSDQSPTHVYAALGDYTVTLTVTDATGQSNATSAKVTVTAAPQPSFTYAPLDPGVADTVQFTDTSTEVGGTIASWSWDFGDGSPKATEQSPAHTYLVEGPMTVTLTVTDTNGVSASTSEVLTVGPPSAATAPVALFAPASPAWNLADGTKGATVTASSGWCCGGHEPQVMLDAVVGLPWATQNTQPGKFATIRLRGTTPLQVDAVQVQPRADGFFEQRVADFAIDVSTDGTTWTQALTATAADSGDLQTFALPTPALASYVRYRPLTNRGGCCNISTSRLTVLTGQIGSRTVTFSNLSSHAATYRWSFGDGGTSTAASPTHTFAQPGDYTVTLTARSVDGREDVYSLVQTVAGPAASFSVEPAAPPAGYLTAFADTSAETLGTIVSRSWDFGDGSTSADANPTHVYAAPGSYSVRLTVVDDNGLADTVSRTVAVGAAGAAPVADFDPQLAGGQRNVGAAAAGASVAYTDARVNCCHAPISTLIDGNAGNGQWWSFDRTPGQAIRIALAEPAVVDGIRLGIEGGWWEMIHDFDVAVSSTTADPAAFTTVLHATTQWTTGWQEFALPRPFLAKYVEIRPLTVSHDTPCCFSLTGVQVLSGADGGPQVTFHNLSAGATSYSWDFGDGQTSSEESPGHTYAGPGTYTVRLTATGPGGTATVERQQVVRAADFSWSPSPAAAGDLVRLHDDSPVAVAGVAWQWSFDDGTTSSFHEPVKVFAAGSHPVTLTVTDADGATWTATHTIDVGPAPLRAAFTTDAATNVAASEGGAAIDSFSGQFGGCWVATSLIDRDPANCGWATANGTSSGWVRVELGDGGGPWLVDRIGIVPRVDDVSQRPSKIEVAFSTTTADAPAFATVLQALPDNGGTLQVFELPRPMLARYVEYRPLENRGSTCCVTTGQLQVLTGQIGGRTVTFRNLSTGAVSYAWDFGDGTTGTGAEPTHAYAAGGVYTVRLTATDAGGATDTTTLVYHALAPLQASFHTSPAPPFDEGQAITFASDAPAPAEGSIAEYRWDWGDGSSPSFGATVGHRFPDNGTYTVKLTVTDSFLRTATATDTYTVDNVTPTIELGADREIYEANVLSFGFAATDPGAVDNLRCTFDYGDGTAPETKSCGSFSHDYGPGATTYAVGVTVRDKDGAEASDTMHVTTKPRAQEGFAATDFVAGGVPGSPRTGCCGPIGLAFDSANRLYVSDYATGQLYRFDAAGGAADSAHVLPGNVGCRIAGLAFSKSGRLYGARQSCSDVVEISPDDGHVVRVVASGVPCATGLAADPLSGDLFATTIGCSGDLKRISHFEDAGPVTVTGYGSPGGVDGITFAPDGTIYLEAGGHAISLAGTDRPDAGARLRDFGAISTLDGIAVASSGDPSAPPFIFANRNDGIITKVDLTQTPPVFTDIFKGGSRGDFVAVGPDGCLYATQSDRVVRVTNADGTCSLAGTSVVPQLGLAPGGATRLTGQPHTVTATITNVPDPTGTAVTFTVTGANPATGTVLADAAGAASFTYTGVDVGTDTIVATGTALGTPMTSNPATVTWQRPPNTAPVAADQSVTADGATPITLSATDADGDPLTFRIVSGPAHGTLTGTAPAVVYTADGGFAGDDSFTFVADDGTADSNVATVTITVPQTNEPPAPVDDAYSLHAGTTLVVGAGAGVLANDLDADGDALTVVSHGDPGHGALALAADGSFTYAPEAGFTGGDGFDYTVGDGTATATAHVSLEVRNAAPSVTLAPAGPLAEGSSAALSAAGSDPDDDALSHVWHADAGTLTPSADGTTATLAVDDGPAVVHVTVTVADGNGGTDEDAIDVQVDNVAPDGTLQAPDTVDEGASFTLSVADVGDPSGADRAAGFEYAFDCGDGGGLSAFGAAASADCATADDGSRSVRAVVRDKDGGSRELTGTVQVRNVAPTATLTDDGPVDEGDAFHLSLADPADASPADAAAGFEYAFDCGDGAGASSFGSSASATCPTSDDGERHVHATIRDKDGGETTYDGTVEVRNVAPVVDAPEDQSSEEGATADFDLGSFADPGADDPWTVTVDWGDGSTPSAQQAHAPGPLAGSHRYLDDGDYTVEVTVADGDGGTGSATFTVHVANLAPTATLNAPDAVDEGSPFTLTLADAADASPVDVAAGLEYAFDCGDGDGWSDWGSSSSRSCPTDDNGSRAVAARIRDKDGGVSSYTGAVEVRNVAPTVTASSDAPQVWGLPVAFEGTATDPSPVDTAAGLAPTWTFGDGSPAASGLAATHAYAAPGAYTARLTATDKDGGSGSATVAVSILKRPTAIAYAGDAEGLYGFTTVAARLADTADAATARLAGRALVFTIDGHDYPAVQTDATGLAVLQTALPLPLGDHVVDVRFAGDALYLASAATASVTVAGGPGKITAGVLRSVDDGRGGLTVQSDDGKTVTGELQWQKTGLRFHAHTLTALGVSPDGRSGWFAGVGDDGRAFVASVEDNGEPGRDDRFRLWVGGVLQTPADGRLAGGNVQIHVPR